MKKLITIIALVSLVACTKETTAPARQQTNTVVNPSVNVVPNIDSTVYQGPLIVRPNAPDANGGVSVAFTDNDGEVILITLTYRTPGSPNYGIDTMRLDDPYRRLPIGSHYMIKVTDNHNISDSVGNNLQW